MADGQLITQDELVKAQTKRIEELVAQNDSLAIDNERLKRDRRFFNRLSDRRRLKVQALTKQVEAERAFIAFFRNEHVQFRRSIEELLVGDIGSEASEALQDILKDTEIL